MTEHSIVTPEAWLDARKRLLVREKEFTRARDELSAARRELPWVRVAKQYLFDGLTGRQTLADLFGGRSQLIVQHFMFAPDWDVGCNSCSFWADSFDRNVVHLAARDVSFVAVSRAPLAKIEAFRRRMGWSFPWVSSEHTDFNFDYQVSFAPEAPARGEIHYNYAASKFQGPELPGISVFYRDESRGILHTYSCYGRGLDMMNAAYQYLDLVPKGRDEAKEPWPQAWVRLRDSYGT